MERWPGTRLAVYYAAVFTAIGIYMPFWPVWLAAQGVSPIELGVLLSANHWLKIATNPLIARIVDRRGARKAAQIVLAVATLAVFLPFPLVAGFWPLLALTVLNSVFFAAMIPIGENLTLLTTYARGLDYGRIRLWGSIAFISGAFGAGVVLSGRGETIIWAMISAAMVVIVAVCCWLPTPPATPTEARMRVGIAPLLRTPLFALFLLAGGLLQASHAVYYGFSSIAWRAAGISETEIGALWALGVAAEVVLFAFSTRIVEQTGPVALLIGAGVGGVVRWTATPLSDSLPALVVLQMLHALTFAAAHIGAMHFIARAAPAGASATAQGLYSGAVGALSGLAALLAGALYRDVTTGAYFAMAAIAGAGLLAAAAVARHWDGRPLRLDR